MEHKGTKRIETERLVLRPFREGDEKPAFHNWTSDPEETKFLTWEPHENVEITRQIVDSWMILCQCLS